MDLAGHLPELLHFFEPRATLPPPRKRAKTTTPPIKPNTTPMPLFFAYLDAPFTIQSADKVPNDVITIVKLEPKIRVSKRLLRRRDVKTSRQAHAFR